MFIRMQSIRRSPTQIPKSEIRTPTGRIHIDEGLANKSIGTPIERNPFTASTPIPITPHLQSNLQQASYDPSHIERTGHLQNNQTEQSKMRLASRTENDQKGVKRLKMATEASGGRQNQPEKLGGETKTCKLLPAAAAEMVKAAGFAGKKPTSWDGGPLRLYIIEQQLTPDGQMRMKI